MQYKLQRMKRILQRWLKSSPSSMQYFSNASFIPCKTYIRQLMILFLLTYFAFGWLQCTSSPNTSFATQRATSFHLRGSTPSFNLNYARKALVNLVIVPGHAVTVKEDLSEAELDDETWFLLDYQRNQGMPKAFVEHIRKGIEVTDSDSKALLVFSGGQTRVKAGPKSEAVSYYAVAEHFDWWGHIGKVRTRATVEEYASDSFENILFSVCRFKEVTGRYPERITLVGFSFKERRFLNLHFRAIKFPAARVTYIGIDPSKSSGFNLKRMRYWEHRASYVEFQNDPYGCNSKTLQQKRKSRNPFSRYNPYELSCPEIKQLLKWCGPSIYPKQLPWI